MPVEKKLIQNILDGMKAVGIEDRNLSELARRSGVRRATLSDIINEKEKTIQLNTLKKIAKALNCSVSELLEGV